jgi:hypothetical protein
MRYLMNYGYGKLTSFNALAYAYGFRIMITQSGRAFITLR